MNKKIGQTTSIINLQVVVVVSFVWVIFCYFSIFKYSGDYQNYLAYYLGAGGDRFELGFKWLVEGGRVLLPEKNETYFLFFLAMISFVTLSVKAVVAYSIRRENIFFFFLMYVIYLFLLHEANQVRASIALAVAAIVLYFLFKRQFYLATLFFFVSVLFHWSMLVFLVPLFVYRLQRRPVVLWGAVFVGLLGVVVLLDVSVLSKINPMAARYVEFNLGYRFHPGYILILTLIVIVGLLNVFRQNSFSNVLYQSYVILFLLSLSLIKVPIFAVRIMDIANIVMFYYVVSLRFDFRLERLALFVLLMSVAIPRFYVYMSTDSIYRFPKGHFLCLFQW